MPCAPLEMDLLSIYDADSAALTAQLQQLTAFLEAAGDPASYARASQQRDCIGLELQERKSSEAAAVGVLRFMAPPPSAAPPPARAALHGCSGGSFLSTSTSASRVLDQPSTLSGTVVTSSGVSVLAVGGKTLAQRLEDERRAEKKKKAKDKVEQAERAAAADRAKAAEAEAAAQRAAVAQRAAAERLKEMKRKAAAAAAEQTPARQSAGGSRAAASSIYGPATAAGRVLASESAGSARPGAADRAHSARPFESAAPTPPLPRAVSAEGSPAARRLDAGRRPVEAPAGEALAGAVAVPDANDGQWVQPGASRAGAPGDAPHGDAGTPGGAGIMVAGLVLEAAEPSACGEDGSQWATGYGAGGRHEWSGDEEGEAAAGLGRVATRELQVGRAGMASMLEVEEGQAEAGTRAEGEESVAAEVGETGEAAGQLGARGRGSAASGVEEGREGEGREGDGQEAAEATAAAREEGREEMCDQPEKGWEQEKEEEEEEEEVSEEEVGDDFERDSEEAEEEEDEKEMEKKEGGRGPGACAPSLQGPGSERMVLVTPRSGDPPPTDGTRAEQSRQSSVGASAMSSGCDASAMSLGCDASAGVDAMSVAARERLRAFAFAADSEAESRTEGGVEMEGSEGGSEESGEREIFGREVKVSRRRAGGRDDGDGYPVSHREAPAGMFKQALPLGAATGESDTPNGAAVTGNSDCPPPAASLSPDSTLGRLRLMFPTVGLPQLRAVLDSLHDETSATRADAGAGGGAGAQRDGSQAVSCCDGGALPLSTDSPPLSRAAAAVYRIAFVLRKGMTIPGTAAPRPCTGAIRELAFRYGRLEGLWCSSSGAPSGLMPPPDILAAHLAMATNWGKGLRPALPPAVAEWRCRYVHVAQAKEEVHDLIRDFCAASAAGGEGGAGSGGCTGGCTGASIRGCTGAGTGAGDAHGPGPAAPAGATARLPVWVELFESPEGGERLAPGWDLLWTWKSPRVAFNELLPWQRVNHFPHSRQLTRKDLLKKNLERARAAPGRADAYDVMPLTFALPAEYNAFAMAFAACREHAEASGGANVWIMKPTGSGASRGRRITLLNDITGVSYGEAVVLQRYVERPLLLDGFKFDLRLYVLVTSCNPLEAFLYTEGFGRFATEPYTLDPAKLSDLYVHLTNSSIQRERPQGEGSRSGVVNADEGGSKCSLSALAARLAAAGVPWAGLWASVREVVLRSLAAVQDAIPHQRNSFELFGYDILIDEQLKCWLIEVNASPSLARHNPLDFAIKDRLIADTLQLVAPPYFDRAVWAEMLKARLEPRGGVRPAKGTPAAELAAELCAMLHGEPPRLHGQTPAHLGLYERIAPSALWDRVCKRR